MFCDGGIGRYFGFFSNFVELGADCPAFIAGGCQSTLDVSDIITFQDLFDTLFTDYYGTLFVRSSYVERIRAVDIVCHQRSA